MTNKKQKTEIVKEEKIENQEIKEKIDVPKEEVKKEPEKKKDEKKKVKKTDAFVSVIGAPISTKYSIEICRYIKGKNIDKAISMLKEVIMFKKAVPMRGEIPHRRGKGMMAGRYPQNASKYFILILKSLSANASINGLENPIISEAIANLGSRPYGKKGSVRKKRTNIKIIAKEKKIDNKEEKK